MQVVGPLEIKQSEFVHEKIPLFSTQPIPTQIEPDGAFSLRLQEFDELAVQLCGFPTVVQFCIAPLLQLQVVELQTQALPLQIVPLGMLYCGGIVATLTQFVLP